MESTNKDIKTYSVDTNIKLTDLEKQIF